MGMVVGAVITVFGESSLGVCAVIVGLVAGDVVDAVDFAYCDMRL